MPHSLKGYCVLLLKLFVRRVCTLLGAHHEATLGSEFLGTSKHVSRQTGAAPWELALHSKLLTRFSAFGLVVTPEGRTVLGTMASACLTATPPPPLPNTRRAIDSRTPAFVDPPSDLRALIRRVAGARCPRARALQQQHRIAKHWLQMVCPTANATDISGAAWRRSTPKRQALQRRRLSARPLASWTTERQRWWYCSARHTCALDDRSRSAAQSESLQQSGSGCVAIKAARLRGSIASPSHCG